MTNAIDPQDIEGRRKTVYPRDSNKGLRKEFLEGYWVWQKASEKAEVYTSQNIEYSNQDDYSSLQCVENNKVLSQKYRQMRIKLILLQLVTIIASFAEEC